MGLPAQCGGQSCRRLLAIQVVGVAQAGGQKVMVLRMMQGRNAGGCSVPFFAAYSATAMWFDDLKPAFHQGSFFFEQKPAATKRSFNLHDHTFANWEL